MPTSSDPQPPSRLAIVVRALVYALAITILVLYAPEEVEFVYMGF
jgi:hypothetical protein